MRNLKVTFDAIIKEINQKFETSRPERRISSSAFAYTYRRSCEGRVLANGIGGTGWRKISCEITRIVAEVAATRVCILSFRVLELATTELGGITTFRSA